MQNEFEINQELIDTLRVYAKETGKHTFIMECLHVDDDSEEQESPAIVAVRRSINQIEAILYRYELRTVDICKPFETIGAAKEFYWKTHKNFDTAGFILDKETGRIAALIEKSVRQELHGSPGNYCADALTTVSGWSDSFAISGRGPNE